MEVSAMNKTVVTQQVKTANILRPAQGILQRKCACGNHTAAGGECAECAKKKKGLQRKLTIGSSNDPLEQEADRVAEQVVSGRTLASMVKAPSLAPGLLQREDAPKEKTDDEKYKEGLKKVGEAFLETPIGKEILAKLKQSGEDIFSTLLGKIYTGGAVITTISVLAAKHKELPAQIPEIPLDVLMPGLSVKLTYNGPVDKPTDAMLTFKFTEQKPEGSAGKKPMSKADQYRAETARLAAEDAKFRAGMTFKPGSQEDLQQKAEQEAISKAALKYSGGPDIQAILKKYPWLARPEPRRDLQLTMPEPSYGFKIPSLLGEEYKLKLPSERKKKKDEPELQKKLSIGSSHDPLEQEADQVADQVTAMPLNSDVKSIPPRIQRFTGQTSEELDAAPSSVDRALAGSGTPLEPTLRKDMETRFGHDFSQVRVHIGSAAEESAREVNANAYTVGRNIVFGAGRFTPETHDGQKLIAHELAHVIQQKTLGHSNIQRDLKAYNKEKIEVLPDLAGGEAGGTSFEAHSAEASGIRAALSQLIADEKVKEVKSASNSISWFAANHHKNAQLEEIKMAFVNAGYPLAERMAKALYDIHGEYLYSNQKLITSTIFGSISNDLGTKVRAQTSRSMTEYEIRQAKRVFKSAIDYSKVTIEERSKVISAGGYARTIGNTIYFPDNSFQSMALMIHELTHVWQYQTTGWTYAPKALWAQIREGYSYASEGQTADQALRDARKENKTLSSFNNEQQGDILADYFRRLQKNEDISAYLPYVNDIK
jgi:hypothetical protein